METLARPRAGFGPEFPALTRGFGADAPGLRFQLYEYAYYGLVFYALMGSALGISVGLLGAAMLMLLAGLCVLRLGSGAVSVQRGILLGILCAGSFVTIQMVVHQESVMHEYVRSFVTWPLLLIVTKSLSTRPGFLGRFSVVAFLIGLTLLPFLDRSEGRAGLDRSAEVGLANPNQLAAWFGFCALVFMVRGLETRRLAERWGSWAVTIFSLSIVGLTVSRGALAAFGVAAVIVFRDRLKRGFIPVLVLIVVAATAFAFGVFDRALAQYAARGMEETGRFAVWPLVIHRFMDSPLVGVGVSDVATHVPFRRAYTPHNGAMFVALASGIFPLLFFCAFWITGLRSALKGSSTHHADSAYLLPLLIYAFIVSMLTNQAFAAHWVAVSVCVCLHQLDLRRRSRAGIRAPGVVPRVQKNRVLATSQT